MSDVVQLSNAMNADGIGCPVPLFCDGRIHRYHVAGDRPGSKNGWYFADGPVPQFAMYGSWRTGAKHAWQAQPSDRLTPQQYQQMQQRVHQAKLQREREVREEQLHAQQEANSIWDGAKLASHDHPYFLSKGISSHHLRQRYGWLLVPLYDGDSLVSLQSINDAGRKVFLKGGRVTGCYSPLGEATDTIYICEGWATACTLFDKTGLHTVAAMMAGNLKAVALATQRRYHPNRIVVAADNDRFTPGNPGLTMAKEAARAVGGEVVCPEFPEGADGTDWNDLENWRASQCRT